MQTPADINRKLADLVEPVCQASGYEMVAVEYAGSPSGWVVRVYIDRPLGGISFEDCERLSRELSAVLDVEDPVPHAYSLEVSSPGVDRPLRTAEHFRRFRGEVAKVNLERGLGGRRNFKGLVLAVETEGPAAVVLDVDGQTFRLPIDDIASARLVPDWNKLMKNRADGARG